MNSARPVYSISSAQYVAPELARQTNKNEPPRTSRACHTSSVPLVGLNPTDTETSITPELQLLDVSSLDLNCSWDESLLSRIHAPPPIGIGTSEIEGFPSFVLRTSDANSITVTDLRIYVLESELRNRIIYSKGPLYLLDNSISAVHALERLTHRSGLIFLTTFFWKHSIEILLRRSSAWCPECFHEQRKTGAPLYLPLKWSIAVNRMCQKHRRRLSTTCPHCKNEEITIDAQSRIGYCPKCKRWLGNPEDYQGRDKSFTNKELTEQLWVDMNVGLLLAKTPSIYSHVDRNYRSKEQRRGRKRKRHDYNRITENTVFKYDKDLIPKYTNRFFDGKIEQFAATFDLPLKRAGELYMGRVLPTLEEYLIFSCHIKTPLLSFLMKGSHQPTPNEIRSFKKKNFISGEFKNKLPDLRKLEAKARKFLNEDIPPYSLRDTALRLGHSKAFLKRQFPVLCKKIKNKFSAYEKIPSCQSISSVRADCAETTISYFLSGVDPFFHSKVSYFIKHYIEYNSEPVILEWISTMKKLGYRMIRRKYCEDSYLIEYHTIFDKSDFPYSESFNEWTEVGWSNAVGYVRRFRTRYPKG